MTARIDRIKERLSVLVGAGYMAHRLSNLALAEIDGSWDDLYADDISHLAAWLQERQSATNSELRVEWTRILAAFASVRQVRDPISAQSAAARPDGLSEMVESSDDPRPPVDGLAKWKEELPLLSAVSSTKAVPVESAAGQTRKPRGKSSTTEGATRKRPK